MARGGRENAASDVGCAWLCLALLLIRRGTLALDGRIHLTLTTLRILPLTLSLSSSLLLAPVLRAQLESPAVSRGTEWRWTPFVGYAQHSPVGEEWGVTPDWNHVFLGIHLESSVLRFGSASLSYAPVVVPLLRLTHHPTNRASAQDPIYATGFAPFGVKLAIGARGRLEVFAASAVGGLWSTRPIPVPAARAFNVTLEWGGGFAAAVAKGHSLQLGYKFYHISNVYTAEANPGLDGHVIYAGWSSSVFVGQ